MILILTLFHPLIAFNNIKSDQKGESEYEI